MCWETWEIIHHEMNVVVITVWWTMCFSTIWSTKVVVWILIYGGMVNGVFTCFMNTQCTCDRENMSGWGLPKMMPMIASTMCTTCFSTYSQQLSPQIVSQFGERIAWFCPLNGHPQFCNQCCHHLFVCFMHVTPRKKTWRNNWRRNLRIAVVRTLVQNLCADMCPELGAEIGA